jgi:hypothetical protein
MEEGDLSFRKGDVIEVIGAVYKDWWKGTLNGRIGIFPINYVELLRADNDECRVCFEGEADHCLVPCGHSGLCKDCAFRFKECPFCKKHVRHPMKLYRS